MKRSLDLGLDHATMAEYNALLADGWTYLRPTVLWGQAYWWLQRHGTHRLILSPIRGVDPAHLQAVIDEMETPR